MLSLDLEINKAVDDADAVYIDVEVAVPLTAPSRYAVG